MSGPKQSSSQPGRRGICCHDDVDDSGSDRIYLSSSQLSSSACCACDHSPTRRINVWRQSNQALARSAHQLETVQIVGAKPKKRRPSGMKPRRLADDLADTGKLIGVQGLVRANEVDQSKNKRPAAASGIGCQQLAASAITTRQIRRSLGNGRGPITTNVVNARRTRTKYRKFKEFVRSRKPSSLLQVDQFAQRPASSVSRPSVRFNPLGRARSRGELLGYHRQESTTPSRHGTIEKPNKLSSVSASSFDLRLTSSCIDPEGGFPRDSSYLAESYSSSSSSSLTWSSSSVMPDFIVRPQRTMSRTKEANRRPPERKELEAGTETVSGTKKLIATHFQESFYFKQPNWQTDLAQTGASSEYDDDDDEEGEEEERDDGKDDNDGDERLLEASVINKGDKNTAGRAARDSEKGQVKLDPATKTKRSETKKNNEKMLEGLAGFGEKIAHYESHDEKAKLADRSSKSSTNLARGSRRPQKAAVGGSPKPGTGLGPVDRSKVVISDDQNETKTALAMAVKQPRASFFAYLPLSSSSGPSYSIGTSMTSSINFEPSQKGPPMFGTRSKQGGHSKSACENLKMDNLKFMIARNLVATLIGTYILVSLLIIIGLMLPYLFDSRYLGHNNLAHMDQQLLATNLRHQPVISKESRGTQTNDLPNGNQRDELRKRIELQRPLKPNGTQRPDRKRAVLDRLNQLTADANAKETQNLHELWRVVHQEQCQPLEVPFCKRTIESMMPPSVVETISKLKAKDNSPLSYEKTLLPNQFTSAHQPQVQRVLEKYEPLVDVRCYPLMPLFLCSIFTPKCIETSSMTSGGVRADSIRSGTSKHTETDNFKFATDFMSRLFNVPRQQTNRTVAQPLAPQARLVPPCRSVCKEALRRCTFFLEVLSLQLFDLKDCEHLPDSEDENVCVGHRENLLLKQAVENRKCRDGEFKCNDGDCIPSKWRCDGYFDCKDKSDEQKCSKCEVSGQFYCGKDVCISKQLVCDGRLDCEDGRDERLCLRLSEVANSTTKTMANDAKQLPRRLETWNAMTTSWLPVCGAHWQTKPMSLEACKALGYNQVNETLILSGANASSGANATQVRSRRSPPPLMPPGHQEAQSTAVEPSLRSSTSDLGVKGAHLNGGPSINSARDVKSLEGLLRHGAQAGCESKSAPSSSTVHLSCLNFQCGQSVTSYLSRLNLGVTWPATGGTSVGVLSSVPKATLPDNNRRSNSRSGSKGASAEAIYDEPPLDADDLEEDIFQEADIDDDHLLLDDDLSSLNENILPTGANNGTELLESQPQVLQEVREPKAPISSRLVVGGIESMPGEFPYLAALHGGPDEVFFCGGVLISANWLLTAAHCVGNRTQPDGWMVKVGVTRRIASPAFVKKLKVRTIIKHHLFNHGTHLNNDIALILLDELVDFNQYLRPICLPPANLKLGPDNSKDCVVVGFGKSVFAQEANYLHVAHFANVPIVDRSTCSGWYADKEVSLSDGMLCAGYSEGRRDACQGDSGSGLFCRLPNIKQFFVAGLVSFGVQCAEPKLPGVYTSIPHYVDWITKTTRENGHPME